MLGPDINVDLYDEVFRPMGPLDDTADIKPGKINGSEATKSKPVDVDLVDLYRCFKIYGFPVD